MLPVRGSVRQMAQRTVPASRPVAATLRGPTAAAVRVRVGVAASLAAATAPARPLIARSALPPPAAAAAAGSASPSGAPLPSRQWQRRMGGQRRRRGELAVSATKQQFGSFEEMLAGSELPLLVDFYATWCGPCQMMSPTLSSLATNMRGRLQVVKIDTDRYPGIASKYRVQALPTIALFVGGKVVFRFEGVLSEAQLMERISVHLTGSGSGGPGAGPGAGAEAK
ncbi:hypothetical protein PLESTB_001806200 [Pleodorina starrii]|uniref:Thioredoxin domain-containing protein n=1 Tax=Pleodorina starrii TaxID=330485 RepID=A0A9W6FAH8_9CHLO|nr:hypothetical protein PLESTM_001045500 [Pleodorina starrii]GLC61815.1 hypothetical protein PLESTB_001806200 [Pleodorina starrii]